MIHKLYYNTKINNPKYKTELIEGDIVKVDGEDILYKVTGLHNSDLNIMDFGRCEILDVETYTKGYNSMPISKLVFVSREFHDPEEILS